MLAKYARDLTEEARAGKLVRVEAPEPKRRAERLTILLIASLRTL